MVPQLAQQGQVVQQGAPVQQHLAQQLAQQGQVVQRLAQQGQLAQRGQMVDWRVRIWWPLAVVIFALIIGKFGMGNTVMLSASTHADVTSIARTSGKGESMSDVDFVRTNASEEAASIGANDTSAVANLFEELQMLPGLTIATSFAQLLLHKQVVRLGEAMVDGLVQTLTGPRLNQARKQLKDEPGLVHRLVYFWEGLRT